RITDTDNHAAIRQAAQHSQADEVIGNLPHGYNTQLGKQFEKGEELSMGQWQRIALSRSLFKDAPILVLDEPTSWMDRETQKNFYEILEKIKKDKVVILISHNEKSEDKKELVQNEILS
ncbi:ABC transporter ATP-binding protein, partial [bacterium]|nr:ABC transporter ATP-binding protein [bacterium]